MIARSLLLSPFLLLCSLLYSQETWTDHTSSAGIGGILHDVAFGEGLYVAVGTNRSLGTIHTSPDGEAWADRTQPPGIGGILHAVAYGGGRFVAVGTNSALGLFASSTDGTTWTDYTAAANVGGILRDVAYGNGTWVAVGETGSLAAVATSTDGTSWTNRTTTAGIAGNLHGITFANNRFVAIGTNGALVVFATSTDGQSWNVHTTSNGIGGVAFDVVHDGSLFIATGDGTPSGGSTLAHVLTSPNGETWTSRTGSANLGGIGRGLGSGGGSTVLVGRTSGPGLLATSGDGISWTNRTTTAQAPGDLNAVTRGTSGWVAVGTNQVNGIVLTSGTTGGGGGEDPLFVDDEIQIPAMGGGFTARVTAGSGSEWTATAQENWISLEMESGTGNGQVTGTAEGNPSVQPRQGNVSIGTDTVVIRQAGADLSAPTLNGFLHTDTNAAELWWNRVSAADGYELQRRDGPDGEFVSIANLSGSSTREFMDTGLAGGVSYAYRIRGFEGATLSSWSNILILQAPPDIPGGFMATPRNATQIELTWNDVEGESGYLIYRAPNDEAFFQQVARVGPDETRFIDSGLAPGSLFRYELEAESSVFGRRTEEVTATTLPESDRILWRRAESGFSSFLGAAYGNGRTVLVGSSGRVTTSTDLLNWTDQTEDPANSLRAVDFAGGRFIAVGDAGTLLSSTDGLSWSVEGSPVGENLSGIAHSNGTWVAVGFDGAVLTRSAGDSWTAHASPAENGFVDVFASGDAFYAIETSGRFLRSEDGINWAEVRPGTPPAGFGNAFFWTRTAGAFGAGNYSVVGPAGHSSHGSDGQNWTEESTGEFNYFNAVAHGNRTFVAVGTNGRTATAPNGRFYFSGPSLERGLNAVVHTPGGFVTAGEQGFIATSPDGVNWSTVQTPEGTRADIATIRAADDNLIAFGEGPSFPDAFVLLNRLDGNGWAEQALEVPGIEFAPRIEDLLYRNGRYIAVGKEGVVLTSPDGSGWTVRRTRDPGPFNDDFGSLAFGQGRLIAAGGNNPLMESLDNGNSWNAIPDLPDRFNPGTILYGPRWVGHFGGSGTIRLWYSEDSRTWEEALRNGGSGYADALLLTEWEDEALFLGVGADFDGDPAEVMASWDGRNWNALPAPAINGDVTAVVHGNGLFLAAGRGGDHLWASLNGVDWEPAPEGFLPERVDFLGGFWDLTFSEGVFYGVGRAGLIVAIEVTSESFARGDGPALPVEASFNGNRLTLRWESEAGATYRVLRRENLATDDWVPVSDDLAGTGGELQFEEIRGPEAGPAWWIVEAF